MFNTELDINSLVVTIVSLTVLSMTITAILGFSIKKLFHFMK